MTTKIKFALAEDVLANVLEQFSRNALISHGLYSARFVERILMLVPYDLPERFEPRPEFIGLDERAENPDLPELGGISIELERFLGDYHAPVVVFPTPEEQASHFELKWHAEVKEHRLVLELSVGLVLEFQRIDEEKIQMEIVHTPDNFPQTALMLVALWKWSHNREVVEEARNILLGWIIQNWGIVALKGLDFAKQYSKSGEMDLYGEFYSNCPDGFKNPRWLKFG